MKQRSPKRRTPLFFVALKNKLFNETHKNPKQRILMFFNAIKENDRIEKHTGTAKLNNVRLRLYLDLKRQYLSLLHNFCILLRVMRSGLNYV